MITRCLLTLQILSAVILAAQFLGLMSNDTQPFVYVVSAACFMGFSLMMARSFDRKRKRDEQD